MKMKTLVRKVTFTLILLAVSFTLPVNAQIINELAKIDVFRAIVNGQDMIKMSTENEHCLQFYKQGKDIFFANNYVKQNSKSYGKITSVEYKKCNEKDGLFSDVYQFKWCWKNSFDNETGVANVFLKVVTFKDGKAARIIIVSEDVETLCDYGGFFNGSLNSLKEK